MYAFRGTLGIGVRLCGPADQEAKGPSRAGEWLLTLDEVIVSCDGTDVAHHHRCLARHQ
ncbi:MAG TPA: hypothetical protein VIX41_08260 [Acidimicrobiales bacterium]